MSLSAIHDTNKNANAIQAKDAAPSHLNNNDLIASCRLTKKLSHPRLAARTALTELPAPTATGSSNLSSEFS